jgi:hypothetical protein
LGLLEEAETFPSLRLQTKPIHFQKVVLLVTQNSGRWTQPRNPAPLNVGHQRQNPLNSPLNSVFPLPCSSCLFFNYRIVLFRLLILIWITLQQKTKPTTDSKGLFYIFMKLLNWTITPFIVGTAAKTCCHSEWRMYRIHIMHLYMLDGGRRAKWKVQLYGHQLRLCPLRITKVWIQTGEVGQKARTNDGEMSGPRIKWKLCGTERRWAWLECSIGGFTFKCRDKLRINWVAWATAPAEVRTRFLPNNRNYTAWKKRVSLNEQVD